MIGHTLTGAAARGAQNRTCTFMRTFQNPELLMSRTGFLNGRAISPVLIGLALLAAPPTYADKSAREAVEALEAYAVYKMAMYEDAFSRFMALAQKGNHQGMLNVAGMLAAGQGTTRDLEAAFSWYQQLAAGGNPIGMFYVAQAYQHGQGVDRDHAAARQWYQRASDKGSQDAQVAYARLLLDSGEAERASRWLERWADSNRGASELLATIQGTDNRITDIPPLDRVLITNAWRSIDRSAHAGNAHGVVYYINYHAQIRMRLPGLPTWTELAKDELRALWQRNFDLAGQYQFTRDELQIDALGDSLNRYRIRSTIDEVLPLGLTGNNTEAGQNNQALRIAETAIVSVVEGQLQIEKIDLDITADN
jgi:TPR repeat protein